LDLKYTLTRWLVVSGGYDYLKRDSSFSDSDYDRNNVYLNLIFAL
jgi:hypothetical protein